MKAWKVIDMTGRWIDTVYYLPQCDQSYVLQCESQYEECEVYPL